MSLQERLEAQKKKTHLGGKSDNWKVFYPKDRGRVLKLYLKEYFKYF